MFKRAIRIFISLKLLIVFMETSFRVNMPKMALEITRTNAIEVEVVDPEPEYVLHPNINYKNNYAWVYSKSVN